MFSRASPTGGSVRTFVGSVALTRTTLSVYTAIQNSRSSTTLLDLSVYSGMFSRIAATTLYGARDFGTPARGDTATALLAARPADATGGIHAPDPKNHRVRLDALQT